MAVYKKSNSGYLPFIQKEKVTSPFTDIQNRAKVDASLKCIMGNERIHVNSLNKLNNEFGPNGEDVYEADSGDSRLRFVGNWVSFFGASGLEPYSNTNGNYIEVTFYGTGLNMLGMHYDVNIGYSVDGGVINNVNFGSSSVLTNRNYKPFINNNIVSGLSLGWHTVKIEKISDGANSTFTSAGFEIINESTQITVKSGKAHGNGYEYSLESDQLIDYNLGFDNVLDGNIGTKGGRVIVYMDPKDGSIKKRLTKTDTTAQYLGSTDHSNESIVRVINFREFGRNRADDFSTLPSSGDNEAVFTLDDGTTNLTCLNSRSDLEGVFLAVGGNSYVEINFVGTGLDIVNQVDSSGMSVEVSVDGSVVVTGTGTLSGEGRVKICSGLPYGTHTVRISRLDSIGSSPRISDFLIYQPKKPSLPEGAIELADYNLMADYDFDTTGNNLTISKGVLRKDSSREILYSGGGWTTDTNPQIHIGGFNAFTNVSGDYFEYTFFGTGIDWRFRITGGSSSNNNTVTLNGLLATTTNFPTLQANTSGTGTSFNTSTGIADAADASTQNGVGISLNNLPLGLYTIRVTSNQNFFMQVTALDIITPIHSYNTTFGSLSMKDCRNFDSTKDINKIAKTKNSEVSFDSSIGGIDWSKNISQILTIATGFYDVFFEEVYDENKPYISVTSGQPIGRLSGPPQSHKVRVGITNTSDVGQTTHTVSTKVSGKLQKDKLEENE